MGKRTLCLPETKHVFLPENVIADIKYDSPHAINDSVIMVVIDNVVIINPEIQIHSDHFPDFKVRVHVKTRCGISYR